MNNPCIICRHPNRREIEKARAREESLREIAREFQVSKSSVARHQGCMVKELEQLRNAARLEHTYDINEEVERGFSMIHRLLDACDEWLRDANDRSRYYIGPRAEEILVTFTERTPSGKEKLSKAWLSELIEEIEGDGRKVLIVRTKYVDPRKLLLKAVGALQKQIIILAKLTGAFKKKSRNPQN